MAKIFDVVICSRCRRIVRFRIGTERPRQCPYSLGWEAGGPECGGVLRRMTMRDRLREVALWDLDLRQRRRKGNGNRGKHGPRAATLARVAAEATA